MLSAIGGNLQVNSIFQSKEGDREGQTLGGVVYTDGKMLPPPTTLDSGFDLGRGPPARWVRKAGAR